jgi:hypothetical protein
MQEVDHVRSRPLLQNRRVDNVFFFPAGSGLVKSSAQNDSRIIVRKELSILRKDIAFPQLGKQLLVNKKYPWS